MKFVVGRLVVMSVCVLPHWIALAVIDKTADWVWGKPEQSDYVSRTNPPA